MVNTTEGAAYGAAILAGVGSGEWPSVESACSNLVRIVERVSPDMNKVPLYIKLHEEYRALYPALKGSFDALSMM
jgi:xylulokinase